MPLFADHVAQLAQRRGLRRSHDGQQSVCRIKLSPQPGAEAATLSLCTRELDASSGSSVMSEAWPLPLGGAAHLEWLQQALRFNRNAMAHLHCGLAVDPQDESLYRLIWQVPVVDLPAAEWNRQLKLFALLVNKAWASLPRPGSRALRPGASSTDDQVIFMP